MLPRFFVVVCTLLMQTAMADIGGKLPLTGGVTQVEGAGGGGLVPWALIAGYGTAEQIKGTAFISRVSTQGFALTAAGAAVGIHDSLELSFARQRFDLGTTVPGQQLRQDIWGAKWKMVGDAVVDQDKPWPQLAVGIMAKRNLDFEGVPRSLGARHGNDIEPYVAATKLWLDGIAGRTTLINGTMRYTRANQLGTLGFGGDQGDRRQVRFEGSGAVLLTDRLAVGIELRQKPNNLGAFKEQRFTDVFVAWAPNKQIAITAAQTDLGNVADKANQHGPYVSIKFDF